MTDLVMYPAPVCPPNDLRRGDVVRCTNPTRVRPTDPEWLHRGVVVTDPGEKHHACLLGHHAQQVVIQMNGYSHLVTVNADRSWVKVPSAEHSHHERVVSHLVSWDPTEQGEGDDPWEWHLLAALIPHGELDEWLDGDWPEVSDLALRLARMLDERAGVDGPR